MYLLKGVWEDDVLKVEIIYNLEASENHSVSEEGGIVVKEYPETPEASPGKLSVLCANSSGETWFEFINIPLTPEQELQLRLEQQQALIDMLILDSLGGVE